MTVDQGIVDSFRQKFNLTNKKIVMFAGRIGEQKGGGVILKAIAKIKNKIPNVYLLVAGRKEGYGQTMIGRSKKLGLADNLAITGWLSSKELNAAFSLSDVVVMPSLCFDTFGLVVLEAMAHKKPVVVGCFGGPKEIVKDGTTGYVVNSYDSDWMAEKIMVLLDNVELAQKMGKNGYQLLKDNFSLDKQAEKYLFWYNKSI